MLRRLLRPAPARVLDVGGGTGVHAEWLVSDGYEVELLDPVPLHVERAAELAGVTARLGDARELPVPDASADAVLLLARSTTWPSAPTGCGRWPRLGVPYGPAGWWPPRPSTDSQPCTTRSTWARTPRSGSGRRRTQPRRTGSCSRCPALDGVRPVTAGSERPPAHHRLAARPALGAVSWITCGAR
ncbi:class I SAM-dependent methyltransferase [Nonomuraea sp. NPDC003727]